MSVINLTKDHQLPEQDSRTSIGKAGKINANLTRNFDMYHERTNRNKSRLFGNESNKLVDSSHTLAPQDVGQQKDCDFKWNGQFPWSQLHN